MKIKLTVEFNDDLKNIVYFIAKDKPIAARKFKNDLLKHLKKGFAKSTSLKKIHLF